jgi:drug/metabolite transporter (DMT)-like permease
VIRREGFFPVLLALLWGFNWPAVKIALSEIPPFALRCLGLASGSLLLLIVAIMLRRRLTVDRASWLPLIVAGTLNIAGFNIFTALAQLSTTTSRAAILTYTMPIWSVALAVLLLGERVDRRKALALAAGALGIALLAYPIFASGKTQGVIFPLIAALSWALGTIVLKKWPIGSDPMASTAYQLMIGALISGIGAIASGQTVPTSLSAPVAGALAFHIIGAMATAYMLWFAILARNPASTSALLSFAVPVVGVLSAMLLVGDRPSLLDMLGFAAILLAASLAMRARTRQS